MTEPSLAAPDLSHRPAVFEPLDFAALPGWRADDHAAAFGAFLISAQAVVAGAPKARALGVPGEAFAGIARRALHGSMLSGDAARAFFEAEFRPFLVRPASGSGFFTGYYEPAVNGSRVRTDRFTIPIYRRPDDLVEVDERNPPPGLPAETRFARRTERGLAPYPDRRAIESGHLAGRGLELVWLDNAVDAFFTHIQGSARVRLPDGAVMRLAYAAKSGHPYTPIGRALRERGALPAGAITMQSIRAWLAEHPAEAQEVMWTNRSFIFFRETPDIDPDLGPVGAAGVSLTAGRSLAVDRRLHTFHSPVFVETSMPDGDAFQRLMIAQDTGSAIVGPARGDIFFGSGDAAGEIAGAMRAEGRFVLLAPKGFQPGAGP